MAGAEDTAGPPPEAANSAEGVPAESDAESEDIGSESEAEEEIGEEEEVEVEQDEDGDEDMEMGDAAPAAGVPAGPGATADGGVAAIGAPPGNQGEQGGHQPVVVH